MVAVGGNGEVCIAVGGEVNDVHIVCRCEKVGSVQRCAAIVCEE